MCVSSVSMIVVSLDGLWSMIYGMSWLYLVVLNYALLNYNVIDQPMVPRARIIRHNTHVKMRILLAKQSTAFLSSRDECQTRQDPKNYKTNQD